MIVKVRYFQKKNLVKSSFVAILLEFWRTSDWLNSVEPTANQKSPKLKKKFAKMSKKLFDEFFFKYLNFNIYNQVDVESCYTCSCSF